MDAIGADQGVRDRPQGRRHNSATSAWSSPGGGVSPAGGASPRASSRRAMSPQRSTEGAASPQSSPNVLRTVSPAGASPRASTRRAMSPQRSTEGAASPQSSPNMLRTLSKRRGSTQPIKLAPFLDRDLAGHHDQQGARDTAASTGRRHQFQASPAPHRGGKDIAVHGIRSPRATSTSRRASPQYMQPSSTPNEVPAFGVSTAAATARTAKSCKRTGASRYEPRQQCTSSEPPVPVQTCSKCKWLRLQNSNCVPSRQGAPSRRLDSSSRLRHHQRFRNRLSETTSVPTQGLSLAMQPQPRRTVCAPARPAPSTKLHSLTRPRHGCRTR